jgi:hypothetical protein
MLRKSLATLPATLDQTYDRILSMINKDDAEYAIRILRWLTFSARPLSVEEVAEVVAIDLARNPAFDCDEVLEDPLEVLDICSSLITITTVEKIWDRPGTQIVALAHYSVQEYLMSDRIKQGPAKQYSMQEAECHDEIAKASLKYLMELQQPFSAKDLKTHRLARYSAKFWSHHFRKTADRMGGTSHLALTLFSRDNPAYFTWIQLSAGNVPGPSSLGRKRLQRTETPLYYAAQLGLRTIVRLLLDAGAEAQDGCFENALQAASAEGKEQMVKILLDEGAEINKQSSALYGNALQTASAKGHECIVKILLDEGADVNAQNGYYGNALQAASAGGHREVVRILLENGADVNAQNGYYGNALQVASAGGHREVVRILLENGADVNAQTQQDSGRYRNAIQAASDGGYPEIVQILLGRGAIYHPEVSFIRIPRTQPTKKPTLSIQRERENDTRAQYGDPFAPLNITTIPIVVRVKYLKIKLVNSRAPLRADVH